MSESTPLHHLLTNAPFAASSEPYPYQHAPHRLRNDRRAKTPRAASGRTFNRSDIVKAISKRQPELPQDAVNHSVKVLIDGIAEALRQGRRVELRNFGIFQATYSGVRLRHNPATLAPFMKMENIRIRFKAGQELRRRVKGRMGAGS